MTWYRYAKEFYFNTPVKVTLVALSYLYVYDLGYTQASGTINYCTEMGRQDMTRKKEHTGVPAWIDDDEK